MIVSYRDKRTRTFAEHGFVKEFQGFVDQAMRRLAVLHAAQTLTDLAALRSNHLEALSGDRRGQYSIRINMQWRICFDWPAGADGPGNVEVVDYH